MFSMISKAKKTATYGYYKVDGWFRRVFKEQAGGAEVIATLIIIAVVLVLALAFRDNLSTLIKDLWNNMTNYGKNNTEVEIPDWQ